MSFHTGQSFTFGETPSATKWNYLWENDYALADGTGIEDDAIDSRHIITGAIDPDHHADRTRRHALALWADQTGGAVIGSNEGTAVEFTGTPSGYARAVGIVPADYAGGDISVKLYLRSSATNSNESTEYYLACRSIGDVHSSWNIASGITSQQVSLSTTWSVLTLTNAIPDASVDALDYVALAWGIRSALSGTAYLAAVVLEYTSNS